VSKRHPNPNLAKIHHSYEVSEIAKLFGIHKNTVRTWIHKDGLPTADTSRPTLVRGSELRAFLQTKRTKNKQTCALGELYCCRCRVPKKPACDMADYQPINARLGKLTAICPDCEIIMHQNIGAVKLALLIEKTNITITKALKRLESLELKKLVALAVIRAN
jgi:excisionase family DNA binding protein